MLFIVRESQFLTFVSSKDVYTTIYSWQKINNYQQFCFSNDSSETTSTELEEEAMEFLGGYLCFKLCKLFLQLRTSLFWVILKIYNCGDNIFYLKQIFITCLYQVLMYSRTFTIDIDSIDYYVHFLTSFIKRWLIFGIYLSY